jgi:1A family penicillin-binding protein
MKRMPAFFARLRLQRVLVGVIAVAVAVSAVVVGAWLTRYALAIRALERGVGDTVFYSADGRPWFRMDEQRADVPLAAIAPDLQHAVLAVEDHRFFRHPGIDPIALGRALFRNARAGEVTEGASTLTQQLARTLFLSNTRTYGRKVKEAALALLLEVYLTKAQILELYLNRMYLSAGVCGVEPISRKLYGKHARDLTLAEAALVAGLIRAPSALSPWSNPEGALARSHLVLRRMVEQGFITREQEDAALAARVAIRPYPHQDESRAGYAKEFLRQQFRDHFGGDHPPDWQVHTTFVPAVQDAAEQAVEAGLRRSGIRGLEAALVALDPRSGDLLALVGGRDYRSSPFDRATRSRRQPGSAFKPFVYAAALDNGLSPVSVLSGLNAVGFSGPDEWTPHNASGAEPDELTLRAALVESDNRAAVRLQQQIGLRPVLRLASALGMDKLPEVPSLALGTGLVSPLQLTAAFAVFPSGGLAVEPRGLVRVLDAHGESVLEQTPQSRRVLSEQVAFQMVSMLQDVVSRGTASAVSAAVRLPLAGKTGTTDDFKDAWFVGFSTSVVVGVWVGFDQPAKIGPNAYGARLALPIWVDFVRRTARALPARPFRQPGGLREEVLCRVSYLRPVDGCPTYTEYFKEGDAIPSRLCRIHEGSLKQRAQRTFEGILGYIGKRLRDAFRR